jgi:hypothetical protein
MKAFALNSGKTIAIVYKVGTSTLSRAIIEQEQPDQLDILLNGTRWGSGTSFEQGYNHRFVKRTEVDGKELLFPVRDPVERFRSACAQVWKAGPLKDKTLEELIADAPTSINPHFRPHTFFLDKYRNASQVKLYKFPEHFDQMATDAGLTLPLPVVNESGTKPDLTPEQVAQVEAIYADDIALFNSITAAGQIYVFPPVPATNDDKRNYGSILVGHKEAAERAGFTIAGKQISTATERDIQKLIAVGTAALENTGLTIPFETADGSFYDLTSTQAKALYRAYMNRQKEIMDQFKAKRTAIIATSTIDELEALDLTI